MRWIKSINLWVANILRKRHIAVHYNDEERWRADLSPAMLVTICVAVVTLVFCLLLLFVAYTPLLDVMPGYRTNAGRAREMLIRSVVRVDSLERKINDMLTYNENRILVVSGKTPAMQSVKNDSLQRAKAFVPASKEDSLLRQKIENDERYRLNPSNPNQSGTNVLNAVAPMRGIVSERFNSKSLLGIRINGAKEASVSATADGVVVMSEWSPEAGHCVVIQHVGGFMSLYRNLANVLVNRGDAVKSAQTIGTAGGTKEEDKSVLEFELWCDGKAVNPELYIVF